MDSDTMIQHLNPFQSGFSAHSRALERESFGTLKSRAYKTYLFNLLWWREDTIDPYTAAEDGGGPSRSEAGVAIEPYDRVPFSQTQSLEPQSFEASSKLIELRTEANNAHYNSIAIIDADGTDLGIYRNSYIPDGPGGYQEKFYSILETLALRYFRQSLQKLE
ncbi:hypothetical protein DY000_02030505 [Brassica cretica]|uniref:Uncharacterized protein n=1 Tax=Brassica cretica TaxID=69181 RepID=A0ABQ7DFG9_BRACR|nr:hypothetical protein DY000_02030505 [Brassica cretica]